MSLFSKLFGGKRSAGQDAAEPWNRTQRSAFGADEDETPIGRSWGERMPNEPNQYNYPGSYREYFEDIFSGFNFGGGSQGNGNKTHQANAGNPLIHTPNPFVHYLSIKYIISSTVCEEKAVVSSFRNHFVLLPP